MEELVKLLVKEVSDLRSGQDEVMEELRLLREAVERLREAVEREMGKRVKGIKQVVFKVKDYEELSEGEREVVRIFVEWLAGKERELAVKYLEGEAEGLDLRVNRAYLRRLTLEEFLDKVCIDGGQLSVLRLLGEVGLLKYRVDERGRRQYCIPVRMRLVRNDVDDEGQKYTVRRSFVSSRYVVDWGRARELYELVKKEKSGQEAKKQNPIEEV